MLKLCRFPVRPTRGKRDHPVVDDISIRPATTPDQIEAVRALSEACRVWEIESFPAFRENLEAYYEPVAWKRFLDGIGQAFGKPGTGMLLAMDGERPVGKVMYARKTDDVAEIRRLFVDPARRGQRIGLRLMTECLERIRADGYREVSLVTTVFLEDALRLYGRLGFETVPIPEATPEIFRPVLVAMRLPL